tara:strand:+ start:452 stop:673 length:222 start_codon:yes stop_codon:yes gene_type:complete
VNTNKLERLFYIFVIFGLSFFTGVFYTYYKIDQRLWNENILKARDIETRLLNYPKQRCYKQADIDKIVYGNTK